MKNIKRISLFTLSTLIIGSVMIGTNLKSINEDDINVDVNKYNSFNGLVINDNTTTEVNEKVEVKSDIKKDNNTNSNKIVSDSKVTSTTSSSNEEVIFNDETKGSVDNTKKDDVDTSSATETYQGNISGYGHDCYGCTSGRTAAGIDISDGHIYYEDSEYGRIRMVAGDKKYPFGTIVKITNFMGLESFYAIVEDRGGAIGLDKNIQFDLLYPQNSDAINVGIQKNVTFEIMRLGY